jgi:hypothetical protein
LGQEVLFLKINTSILPIKKDSHIPYLKAIFLKYKNYTDNIELCKQLKVHTPLWQYMRKHTSSSPIVSPTTISRKGTKDRRG